MTGRCPDYTVFSVDIGVTDVTRNRRLFVVTSTTCSTLFKELVVVTAVFSPPIDIKHYSSPAHTGSVRADSSSKRQRKLCIVTSFETDLYTSQIHKIPGHTYAVFSCVWRQWVVFLEHGGGALGIFKSPVCTYNQAWTFFVSFTLYFLPQQA